METLTQTFRKLMSPALQLIEESQIKNKTVMICSLWEKKECIQGWN